jgi:hypothetical protein
MTVEEAIKIWSGWDNKTSYDQSWFYPSFQLLVDLFAVHVDLSGLGGQPYQ